MGFAHRCTEEGSRATRPDDRMLQTESFKLMIADEMGEWLAALAKPGAARKLSEMEKRAVEIMNRRYTRSKKIPTDTYTICDINV